MTMTIRAHAGAALLKHGRPKDCPRPHFPIRARAGAAPLKRRYCAPTGRAAAIRIPGRGPVEARHRFIRAARRGPVEAPIVLAWRREEASTARRGAALL